MATRAPAERPGDTRPAGADAAAATASAPTTTAAAVTATAAAAASTSADALIAGAACCSVKIGVVWKHQLHGGWWPGGVRHCLLLDEAAICLFRQPPRFSPQGRVELSDAQLQLRRQEGAIYLTVLAESRIYRLRADNADELLEWADALDAATCRRQLALIKMGYLYKSDLGSSVNSARRLWCVLDRGCLFYFKQPPDFSPTEAMPISSKLSIVRLDERNRQSEHGIRFQVGCGSLKWLLSADSEASREDWIHALEAIRSSSAADSSRSEGSDAAAALVAVGRKGWLQKESKHLKRWNPRYLSLSGGVLCYYTRPADTVPRASAPLVQAMSCAQVELDAKDRCIIEVLSPSSGLWRFKAESEAEAGSWCSSLRDAAAAQLRLAQRVGQMSVACAFPPGGMRDSGDRAALSLHHLTLPPHNLGPCISIATFDIDPPHRSDGDGEGQPCANCTPQAARWSCNAVLVSEFSVVWRRVPFNGDVALAAAAGWRASQGQSSGAINLNGSGGSDAGGGGGNDSGGDGVCVGGDGGSRDGGGSGCCAATTAAVLHTECVSVTPNAQAGGQHVLMADCYSSYMPSVDDVGHYLQVEYTPHAQAAVPVGTFASALVGEQWNTYVVRSRAPVQGNPEVAAKVAAALKHGVAEFIIVAPATEEQADGHGGMWCELQVDKRGVRLRRLQPQAALFSLVGRKDYFRRLTFPQSGSTAAEVASVVLPSELLQVRLVDADGSDIVVQAETAMARDAIVLLVRAFAGVSARSSDPAPAAASADPPARR